MIVARNGIDNTGLHIFFLTAWNIFGKFYVESKNVASKNDLYFPLSRRTLCKTLLKVYNETS